MHKPIPNMRHNYLMLNPAKPANQYNNTNLDYLFSTIYIDIQISFLVRIAQPIISVFSSILKQCNSAGSIMKTTRYITFYKTQQQLACLLAQPHGSY